MANLHLIGNAHLDPVWLWRWQEGFSEILATYRSVLDRMKEFPEIKFTSACAIYYQWIEKMDPDMFAEIKDMVNKGRWDIVGGWFLQPDCNIPDGESFIRHALISQRYFKEKFGLTAKTGYNVDSFGHNAALPKILKHSGMDNYVFMRPDPQEQGRNESLFIWESDDGSQVNTYRIPLFYNIDLFRIDALSKVEEKVKNENIDLMAFYGIGNHGGGPSIKLIDTINKMNIPNMKYSTPDEYFSSVHLEELPVIKDELQHHARGCYSANAEIKKMHRICEQNILAAEKLCVMAKELTGAEYPAEKLNKCWKNLMFNQFHDILAGCCIKKAYEDASYLFGEIMSITEQAINFSMQKIAWSIDTLQGETLPGYRYEEVYEHWVLWEHEVLGTPIIVFNPHTHKVTQNIQVYAPTSKMTDRKGNEIPFQTVRGDQTNNEDKYNTLFTAEVPPLGYSVYRLFTEKKSEKQFSSGVTVTENSLENSKIKVILDNTTGDICSIYDKENKQHIIEKPCSAVLLDETDCDTWAHGKDTLGKVVGSFASPDFKIIENGSIRAKISVTTKYGDSTLNRIYSISRDSNVVEVKTKIDFREKHKALKFTFPLIDEMVIAKIPYGAIIRNGYTGEEPFGSWFASGRLCVANDSKYAYDTEDGYIRMTVLRGAIYADHYGKRDDFCEYMEQGIHEFTYTLFPYKSKSDSERRAAELNFGLKRIMGSFHKGTLPEEISCFETDNESIIVSAIKKSEDSDLNIIRFYDANGTDSNASIKLFGKQISTPVSHNELLTFDEKGNRLNGIEWK